jgi:hypothetical protein
MTATSFDEDAIALTFDIEWAPQAVVDDVLFELASRNLVGTFFHTHAGIKTPGHESGLHPNFRRDGDTIRLLQDEIGPLFNEISDDDLIKRVLAVTHEICPEAKGLRTHSLFFELKLLAAMKEMDFLYDSSCLLPLQGNINPFTAMWGITELPIYFMDHLDLINNITGLEIENLKLDQKGLKVFNFHPALIYLNAENDQRYQDAKSEYTDPDALLERRHQGRGTRTLFLDLLDYIVSENMTATTMTDLAISWAATN